MMKMCCCLAVFGVLASALCGSAWAYDLAESLCSGELWTLQRNRNPVEGVYMLDADEMRSYSNGSHSKLEFSSLALGEVLFDWKEPQEEDENADDKAGDEEVVPKKPKREQPKANVLYRVTAMVYTRGDDNEISMAEFNAKVKDVAALLTKVFEKKGKKGMLPANKTALKINTMQWSCEHGVLRLESAFSEDKKAGKKAEIIRIVMASDRKSLDRGGASDKVGKRDLKSNVVTDEDGTIWIKDIPMIDQGDKGYCLPATVARVFAYYGMDGVGMHEIAALCDSEAEGGTSVAAMWKTLKEIGSRFHVRIKEIPCSSISLRFDYIQAYNKEAKKLGKTELPDLKKMSLDEKINLRTDWCKDIDRELWSKACAKKPADVKKWMAPIRKSITAGVPVLWGVFASGLYADKGAGIGESHMRLIIGFNPETNTVVFSDTWGKGTAKRVMTLEQAYSVTDGTYVIQP